MQGSCFPSGANDFDEIEIPTFWVCLLVCLCKVFGEGSGC